MSFITNVQIRTLGVILVVGAALLLVPLVAGAQTTGGAASGGGASVPTAEVLLTKKFSGFFPDGVTADQFRFVLETFPDPITLDYVTDDEANMTVQLPVGTYEIYELWPDSQDQEDWDVQWSGFVCDGDQNVNLATITIEEKHLTMGNIGCRADNEYTAPIPPVVEGCTDAGALNYNDEATTDDGSCTYAEVTICATDASSSPLVGWEVFLDDGAYGGITDSSGCFVATDVPVGDYTLGQTLPAGWENVSGDGDTIAVDEGAETVTLVNQEIVVPDDSGTIRVEKAVTGSSSTSTIFYFDVSWSNTDRDLSAGQFFSTQLATGTYAVTEIVPTGWTQDSVVCVSSEQDTETADAIELAAGETVTCTFTNSEDEDGDNGGGDPDPTPEEDFYEIFGFVWHDEDDDGVFDENEEPLVDWEVTASGTDEVLTAFTDSSGRYTFSVASGTWVVSETIQEGWKQADSSVSTHTVTVPEEETEGLSFFGVIREFWLPTAHAANLGSFGPFNFGNVLISSGTTVTPSGGGGGGTKIELVDSGSTGGGSVAGASDNSGDSSGPIPEVLGEQVSLVPIGAPNTGAGGMSSETSPFAILVVLVSAVAAARVSRLIHG